MTVTELENILTEYKILEWEIEAHTEEIRKTRQLIKALHITNKKTLSLCNEYIEIINNGIARATEEKNNVLYMIDLIENTKERKILYMYFVCDNTIAYIAEAMFYSEHQIIRKKKAALQKLTDIINNQ